MSAAHAKVLQLAGGGSKGDNLTVKDSYTSSRFEDSYNSSGGSGSGSGSGRGVPDGVAVLQG